MLICIKQHLSNILSLIHGKVEQHWGWVAKNVAYKKGAYIMSSLTSYTSIAIDKFDCISDQQL